MKEEYEKVLNELKMKNEQTIEQLEKEKSKNSVYSIEKQKLMEEYKKMVNDKDEIINML